MKDSNSAKLTFECYGHRTEHDFGHEDLDIDEILHAFCGILVAHTWFPSTVLQNMKDFAENMILTMDSDCKEE